MMNKILRYLPRRKNQKKPRVLSPPIPDVEKFVSNPLRTLGPAFHFFLFFSYIGPGPSPGFGCPQRYWVKRLVDRSY